MWWQNPGIAWYLHSGMNWWKIIGGMLLLAGGVWLVRYLMTPPPGTAVEDQGRKHVPAEEVSKTTYNSNPPTSGPHVETWVKAGIFTQPQSEGELIHSLEHGYVIIHYNCNAESETKEATASAINESDTCKTLVQQLEEVASAERIWKLIVVPRPSLDAAIALTAWNRIDKLNMFDRKRIETFIDYWRDHGPEQTME